MECRYTIFIPCGSLIAEQPGTHPKPSIKSHLNALHRIALLDIVLLRIVSYRIAWHCIASHRIASQFLDQISAISRSYVGLELLLIRSFCQKPVAVGFWWVSDGFVIFFWNGIYKPAIFYHFQLPVLPKPDRHSFVQQLLRNLNSILGLVAYC